jgi:hypothetical protein
MRPGCVFLRYAMQPQQSMEVACRVYPQVTNMRRPNLSKTTIMPMTNAHCTQLVMMMVWKGFLKPANAYVYVEKV